MNERLTLTELQLIIKDSLYLALPDMYWVIAEISEIKENYNGHCYLELVEKHPDEVSLRARIRAVIWSNRYRFLKPYFENTTGESLRDGIKVLIRVKIEYHEIYGLSLVINDIDPAFTLGEMALKRQQIIKRLEEEGVLTMNKELDFPVVPQRIAVISSKNAAGYVDFMNHLTSNIYGYIYYTVLFDAPMQGNETENGIIGALEKIAIHVDKFDVVIIIRGGGSQTDLSWFDNYNIAYYITQFPLPVITGIGHEKDLSVTDVVAWRALKTPTAVADFLIECMISAENQIIEMTERILKSSQHIIDEYKKRIETFNTKLKPVVRIMISGLKEIISQVLLDLVNRGKEYVIKAGILPANQKSRLTSDIRSFITSNNVLLTGTKQKIQISTENQVNIIKSKISGLNNSLKILNPINVLKRGYTITSLKGEIVKQSGALKKDDQIKTIFSDGSVKSKVI
jgi:exodeoxyribonuclease VII large subunit